MNLQHSSRPITAFTGRRRCVRAGVCCLAVLTLLVMQRLHAPPARAEAAVPGAVYRLIANPENPNTTVDRRFVARAFLKKVRRWPDGGAIQPVDLDSTSMIRRQWSEDVLERSVEAVKNYWQQLIFAGRDLPPPELQSEDDVVRYVLRTPGAVGYVSSAASLRGAKVLAIQ